MKNLTLTIGILCLVAAAVWFFAVAPQSKLRFPEGWEWEVNTIGKISFADEETGVFPEGSSLTDDPINITIRTVTIDPDAAPDGQAQINDHYETRNPTTNAVEWEFTTTAVIDQESGKHVSGEYEGDYYFLPRNVDKDSTYVISNTSYQHLTFEFQQEEEVAGLNTYKYAFYGDLDNTLSYDYIELEEGQSITCFEFEIEYWAEPSSGEIIKYREWCEGDWVVDGEGERLYAISRWGGETSGDDLIRRVDVVRSMMNSYALNTLYIPIGLAIVGIILLAIYFVPNAMGNSNEQKA